MLRKSSRVENRNSVIIPNKALLPADMATSDFPYFAYPEKAHSPFKQHQFLLVHSSPSKDNLSVSSLNNRTVKKDLHCDVIVRLIGDKLSIKKDADLSLTNFIEQLVEGDSQEVFDVAFKQDLLKRAQKVNILHLAVRTGGGNLLPYLLEKFPDYPTESTDSEQDTLIHAAVKNSASTKPLSFVLNLMQQDRSARDDSSSSEGGDEDLLHSTNKSGDTPLSLAVRTDSVNAVGQLLEAGASMKVCKGKEKNTALHLAAKLNRTRCVREMSEFVRQKEEEGGETKWKKLLGLKNAKNFIPVMLSEETDCIQELLAFADVEAVVCTELGPLLHWASGNDKLNLVQALLGLPTPPNVDKKNNKSFTPLKISSKRGLARIVEALLKGGAKPNYIGKDVGFTALNNAAQYGQFEAVKVLVDNGADLSGDIMTNTALHSAVYGGQPDIVRYLLEECSMSPDILNLAKKPPLFQAINEKRPECLKLLLEHGATMDISLDSKNSSPLHFAIEAGEKQMSKFLLDNGARPEESNANGVTPLMLTTKGDHASLIPMLMSYGIALAKIDSEKNTVFHHAAINGAVKCVDYLIKRIHKMSGVTQEFQIFKNKNEEGKTPFDIALEKRQEGVMALFIPYAPENYFITNAKFLHQMYDKQMYKTLKVIFNSMVKEDPDCVNVSAKYLDSNELGQYPSDKGFKHIIPSLLHKLLSCPDSPLKFHPIVSIVITKKLIIYRWWYIFSFLFYLGFLASLAFALIQASYHCDDMLLNYSSPLDYVRACCEVFCVICWVIFLIDELIEFVIEWIQIRHEKADSEEIESIDIIQSEVSGPIKSFFSFMQKLCNISKRFDALDRILLRFPGAILNYIIGFNIVDFGALVCFLVFAILRFASSSFQWTFASFTFILFGLRLFKYTRIIPALGAYVSSVFRVFVRDIPRFIVIILIISISYIGGIHLAARQQPYAENTTLTSLSGEQCVGSRTQLLWFTPTRTVGYGLRNPLVSSIIFLLDGGPANAEDDLLNVNVLFSILYFFFSFTVIVVLLNILIAQLSETYSEIIKTNQFHYIMELVVNLELKSNLAFLTGKLLRKFSTIDKLKIPEIVWEELKHNCPGKGMERQVDEINEKLENSERIIKEESQKSTTNHEWVQEKMSEMSDAIDNLNSGKVRIKSGDVTKTTSNDPMTFARISALEKQIKDLEKKIDKILTAVQPRT